MTAAPAPTIAPHPPPAAPAAPTLSVIIPCHNASAHLPQTLGALLDQSRPPDEIILVDDASTDSTLDIARRFQAACDSALQALPDRDAPDSPSPDVRIVQTDHHSAAAARNAGAAIARGDLLMFLDADDVLAPDALQGLCSALAGEPRGVAICPWQRLELHDGRWIRRPPSCRPWDDRLDALGNWLQGWYHPTSTVMWTRPAYDTAGRWDPAAGVNDDGDLMMRALTQGVPLVRAQTGLCLYRRDPGAASLSGGRCTESGVASRLVIIEKVVAHLRQTGRLDSYRRPIGEALARLRVDASSLPRRRIARIEAAYAASGPALPARLACARQRALDARQALAVMVRGRLKRRGPVDGEPVTIGLKRARALQIAGDAASREVSRPTVTVIIPTWNRAQTLPRAIDSVLGQTFTDFELLIIDDGSTDNTAHLVSAFDDPRIRFLRQPHNQGVGAARNRGLREARGDFIAFLDSDDEWLPGKLQRQLDRFAELPESVGLLYTGVETITADGRRSSRRPALRGDVERRLLLRNGIHGGGSNVMLRRSIAQQVGFFDEHLPAIEDYDYWLRIARHCHVDYVDDILIRYHAPPTPQRKSDAHADNIAARDAFYRRYEPEMRRAGVAHRFLLESAGRWLAPPAPDRGEARRLALAAARIRPVSRASPYLLLYTLLPASALAWLRTQRRARGAP